MTHFYGNEIFCGSYACLNAMKDSSIDLHLFEISTGTPFGVLHQQNQNFDRLLTTYQDPNRGMDRAISLWGYEVHRQDFESPDEAIFILKKWLKEKHRVLLGPLDMGKLTYYPLVSLLRRMDHYIVLEYWSDQTVLCIDSEGIYGYQISYQALYKSLSVAEVPEACGRITVRHVRKVRDWDLKDILYAAYLCAGKNLSEAEKHGEGSKAILRCQTYLKEHEFYQWSLPLTYDIQYLKQRKFLLIQFLELLHKKQTIDPERLCCLKNIAEQQSKLLGQTYLQLFRKSIDWDIFINLAELEKSLSEKW